MIYHTGIACKTADGTHLSIVPLYVIYHIVQTAKAHSLIQALYHKQEHQTVKQEYMTKTKTTLISTGGKNHD